MVKKQPKKSPEEKAKTSATFSQAGKKVVPHPVLGEEDLEHVGLKSKPGRKRRTDTEIKRDSETEKIREDGFETIAVFFKSLSDNDAARYGLEKQSKEFFYPIAKNYSKVLNYFLPKAKEIYFVITMTAFQSWTMLKARADLVNVKKPKSKKETSPPVVIPDGTSFPGQEEVKIEKV